MIDILGLPYLPTFLNAWAPYGARYDALKLGAIMGLRLAKVESGDTQVKA